MPVEILRVQPQAVAEFVGRTDREALKDFYGFSVVWHEQLHHFAATKDDRILGVTQIRIAASLAHVERVFVVSQERRRGIGRALLQNAADTANYYNCHKMTALVPHGSEAQRFFEACEYRQEGVLLQHTFKLDMAAMRKFLL